MNDMEVKFVPILFCGVDLGPEVIGVKPEPPFFIPTNSSCYKVVLTRRIHRVKEFAMDFSERLRELRKERNPGANRQSN